MNRHECNFDRWCKSATTLIRYGPDRRAACKELYNHLLDAYDACLEKGMTEDDAEAQAIASMGNADDIARQLAAVHKPFWGYMIRVSQIVLAVLLVLCLSPLWDYATDLNLYDAPHVQSFDVFDPASYGAATGRVLHHLSTPHASLSTEAGTFTVTNAAVFSLFSDNTEKSSTHLYLLVKQKSNLPFKEHEKYFNFYSSMSWFSARDSLGNEYSSRWYPNCGENPLLLSQSVQSGIFTGTHEIWINDFPQDAEWVEILCTRDGRNYVLRIDLTGGDPT